MRGYNTREEKHEKITSRRETYRSEHERRGKREYNKIQQDIYEIKEGVTHTKNEQREYTKEKRRKTERREHGEEQRENI